jgi:hypothetical protein
MTIKIIIQQTKQEFEFESRDIVYLLNNIISGNTNQNTVWAAYIAILIEILGSIPLNKDAIIKIGTDTIYGRDGENYSITVTKQIEYKINES